MLSRARNSDKPHARGPYVRAPLCEQTLLKQVHIGDYLITNISRVSGPQNPIQSSKAPIFSLDNEAHPQASKDSFLLRLLGQVHATLPKGPKALESSAALVFGGSSVIGVRASVARFPRRCQPRAVRSLGRDGLQLGPKAHG